MDMCGLLTILVERGDHMWVERYADSEQLFWRLLHMIRVVTQLQLHTAKIASNILGAAT